MARAVLVPEPGDHLQVPGWNGAARAGVDRFVDALVLARALAVVDTAADAALICSAQRAYDLPGRRRRWVRQCAAGAGYLAVLLAGDALWALATGPSPGERELSGRALLVEEGSAGEGFGGERLVEGGSAGGCAFEEPGVHELGGGGSVRPGQGLAPSLRAVLPDHEVALLARFGGTCLAWGVLWWAGRSVPERMRRRGIARPNALLAPALAVGFAASTAPTWWAHAEGRAAAVAR